MKVLAANKFHFIMGGAERYFFDLARIMESKGHMVAPFAMQHERNSPCEHSDLFVSNVSFDGAASVWGKLVTACRVLYSVEARRKIEALADRIRPDVAHLHNIAHQLSPSIIYGLKAKGVPVVQTLHDHKLICPNYQMFVHGEVCERCRRWRYLNACIHRCMHGSLGWSALVCLEAYVHKILGSYARHVDLFIAPSVSLMRRMIAHGVDPGKIVHLPYSIVLDDYRPCFESDGYGICFGRLSPGKGLETLVAAAAKARDVSIKIVGDGPLAPLLSETAERGRLANVEFTGYRGGAELRALISRAAFVIVASECYENSPLAVYEAMALGKATVGSRIGGIPELVEDGETGVLFEPGDPDGLSARLRELAGDGQRALTMGRAGRSRLETEFGPERHYERIMSIYERVVQ